MKQCRFQLIQFYGWNIRMIISSCKIFTESLLCYFLLNLNTVDVVFAILLAPNSNSVVLDCLITHNLAIVLLAFYCGNILDGGVLDDSINPVFQSHEISLVSNFDKSIFLNICYAPDISAHYYILRSEIVCADGRPPNFFSDQLLTISMHIQNDLINGFLVNAYEIALGIVQTSLLIVYFQSANNSQSYQNNFFHKCIIFKILTPIQIFSVSKAFHSVAVEIKKRFKKCYNRSTEAIFQSSRKGIICFCQILEKTK